MACHSRASEEKCDKLHSYFMCSPFSPTICVVLSFPTQTHNTHTLACSLAFLSSRPDFGIYCVCECERRRRRTKSRTQKVEIRAREGKKVFILLLFPFIYNENVAGILLAKYHETNDDYEMMPYPVVWINIWHSGIDLLFVYLPPGISFKAKYSYLSCFNSVSCKSNWNSSAKLSWLTSLLQSQFDVISRAPD
jgi:hypothetical protein